MVDKTIYSFVFLSNIIAHRIQGMTQNFVLDRRTQEHIFFLTQMAQRFIGTQNTRNDTEFCFRQKNIRTYLCQR